MATRPIGAFRIKNFLRASIIILFPALVGLLSGLISKDATVALYEVLKRPPLSPPAFLFPIVWGVLYILSGIASYLVIRKGWEKPEVKDAMQSFWFWLALSFVWPIVFFNFRTPLLAFIILIVMWIFVGITTVKFYRISKPAAYLMIPLWLWTTFAAYLNLGIVLLN
ncbi:MAG: tryptophan-rich sensory protein [Clostridia bacterium]|nr:tryptophan-rich sensory protein [Clostridia bacterium]MBQ3553224.1 tryptophan-rich sensory protein [Clostridia bacterium]